MDDILLLHENTAFLEKTTKRIGAFLLDLGLTLAIKKCEVVPKQTIQFLGWEWNFKDALLQMTQDRRASLLKQLAK
jgi:hypothetical protein